MEMNNVTNVSRVIKRGDVFDVDFGSDNVVGSEQADYRPCICIQNEVGNKFSPVVIVAVITSKLGKRKMPTHCQIGSESGLNMESLVLCEQIKTIDKSRIKNYIGKATTEVMNEVERAIKISLALGEEKYLTMSRESQTANMKAQLIVQTETTLRELMQDNMSTEIIDIYVAKRANRINELKEYCKQNRLDYTRFYSVATDTRERQYK